MNGEYLIQIILMAVSYYLFSNEFFKFSAEIKGEKVSYRSRFLCFIVIYLWFMTASYLELPLVINWFVFLIILGIEVHVAFSFDFVVSYALSMFCIIMGLATNVFFRSLIAILLKLPLNVFDNTLSTLKMYPIFIGFVVMILLLYVLRRIHFPAQLERMLHYRKSLIFFTWTEIFIYIFLMVQLLAYTQSGNDLGIKTWGIKSSLFSAIVLIITNVYALRVASLHYYMQKQHEIHDRLIQEKKNINNLWALAYTDMLTGINNRQLLNKRLEEYAGYGGSITLAFIDVNGLKIINDQCGHMEGDNYLITVARILLDVADQHNIDLFRYGGDEFVMMSNTLAETDIINLLNNANKLLMADSDSSPYSHSISYGVVHGDCTDYHKLITDADELMYKHKLKHYESMVRA